MLVPAAGVVVVGREMRHPSKFASDRRWSPLSAPAVVAVAVAATADGVVLAVAAAADGVVLAVAAAADGVVLAVAAAADGVAVAVPGAAVPVDAVVRPVCPRATRVFSDHGFASDESCTNWPRIDRRGVFHRIAGGRKRSFSS